MLRGVKNPLDPAVCGAPLPTVPSVRLISRISRSVWASWCSWLRSVKHRPFGSLRRHGTA
jgi:hypothetical protein